MSRHRGRRREPSHVSLDGSYRDLERKGSMEGSIRASQHRLRPCCVHGCFAGAPRRGPIDRSGDEETRASWNGLGFWRLDAGPAPLRFERGHQERHRPWGMVLRWAQRAVCKERQAVGVLLVPIGGTRWGGWKVDEGKVLHGLLHGTSVHGIAKAVAFSIHSNALFPCPRR